MTGDYLTTRGRLPDDDRQMLADLGLELVQETSENHGTGFQPGNLSVPARGLCH